MLHYQDISSYIFFDRSRSKVSNQWRVQDFLLGAPTPKVGELTYYFAIFFAENCMKTKEFGPRGSVPGAPLRPANDNLKFYAVIYSIHYLELYFCVCTVSARSSFCVDVL